MRYSWLLLIALSIAAASCGSSSTQLLPRSVDQVPPPELVTLGGKMVSGVPEGVFVRWTRNTEAEATGYFLYRDTQSIPTPPPDELINPALRVNGGLLIPQPPSGTYVDFTDMFPVVVGTTYYYRVTVVDTDGNESYPSNELSWLVHGQTVTGLAPTSAYWGEDVTLSGDTFGVFNPATDRVLFQTAGSNTLEGAVVSWTDTEIVATIPDDSVTGPVYVVVGGTIASTDEDLVILNPHITAVSPSYGFVEQQVVVSGANFGPAPGEIKLGAVDLLPAVSQWTDSEITLTMPDGVTQDLIRVTAAGLSSNGVGFRPRAEILQVFVPASQDDDNSAQSGGVVILFGRYFGPSGGAVVLSGKSQSVQSWSDSEIWFTVNQSVGAHTLRVALADGSYSNDQSFVVLEPMSITISGIDPGLLYLPGSGPLVTVTFPPDMLAFDLYAGNRKIFDHGLSAPPTEVQLNLVYIPNGLQSIYARGVGRGAVVDSNTLTGTFYSLPGDITGDGTVNILDVLELPNYIGLTSADAAFQPWYDTDGDGVVTEADASMVGYMHGNSNALLTGGPG